MTKKDYIAFAISFKAEREELDHLLATVKGDLNVAEAGGKRKQWASDVLRIASLFVDDNSRFDRRKFLLACGYEAD